MSDNNSREELYELFVIDIETSMPNFNEQFTRLQVQIEEAKQAHTNALADILILTAKSAAMKAWSTMGEEDPTNTRRAVAVAVGVARKALAELGDSEEEKYARLKIQTWADVANSCLH